MVGRGAKDEAAALLRHHRRARSPRAIRAMTSTPRFGARPGAIGARRSPCIAVRGRPRPGASALAHRPVVVSVAMPVQPRTPPGVLELLPPQQLAFQHMLDTIRRGFERFGFVPVET